MRVALIGPTYPLRGGIAHYTTLLAQELRARGHAVDLCSFAAGYPRLLYPGRGDRDPSARPLRAEARYLLRPLRPWGWPAAAGAIAAARPDLAVIEWWVPYLAPVLGALAALLRRRGVPVVMDCQNVLPHERHPLDAALTAWALGQSDAALVYSAAHRAELRAVAPDLPAATVRFPTYGPLAAGRPGRAEARRQLGVSGPTLLFFGFVRPYKGLGVLLRAMAQAELPDLHLIVAGEFWEPRADYERLISELGLAGRVTIVDRYLPDEELGAYLSAADALALPYLEPVQSGVLAVAQAAALPVVASAVGGLREGVAEGRTGLLVPPGDVGALAAALRRLHAEGMGAAMAPWLARRAADDGWEAVTAALLALGLRARAGGPA